MWKVPEAHIRLLRYSGEEKQLDASRETDFAPVPTGTSSGYVDEIVNV